MNEEKKMTEFKAKSKSVELKTGELKKYDTNGLECVWSCKTVEDKQFLVWDFNWDDLRKINRICGFTGRIECSFIRYTDDGDDWDDEDMEFKIDLWNDSKLIQKNISNLGIDLTWNAEFSYNLIPILSMEDVYYEMFLESEKNDTVLLVDGFKLHVNKSFLSYHSDFFHALFSSNFKEGQMDEIPIEDVSYEDFGMLLSTIYPKPIYPTDRNIPRLLELADRFMMPSVIHHVEHHLVHHSKIGNEKMMWMADRYGMNVLFEKMLKELNNTCKAKDLKESPDYMNLSNKAKAVILDKVLTMI